MQDEGDVWRTYGLTVSDFEVFLLGFGFTAKASNDGKLRKAAHNNVKWLLNGGRVDEYNDSANGYHLVAGIKLYFMDPLEKKQRSTKMFLNHWRAILAPSVCRVVCAHLKRGSTTNTA